MWGQPAVYNRSTEVNRADPVIVQLNACGLSGLQRGTRRDAERPDT